LKNSDLQEAQCETSTTNFRLAKMPSKEVKTVAHILQSLSRIALRGASSHGPPHHFIDFKAFKY
jgi:hypothetical protein